jgi:hypothetical protein
MALRTKAWGTLPPLRVSRFGPTRPTAAEPPRVWQVEQLRANSERPLVSDAVRCAPAASDAWSWLVRGEVRSARAVRRVAVAVGDQHQHREADAQDEHHDAEPDRPRTPCAAGLRAAAAGLPATAHRREDDRQADGQEDEDEHQGADHERHPIR